MSRIAEPEPMTPDEARRCVREAEQEAAVDEFGVRIAASMLMTLRGDFPPAWKMPVLDQMAADPAIARWSDLRDEVEQAGDALAAAAIVAEARRAAQVRQAARKPRRSKWDALRTRLPADAAKIWGDDRTISDLETAGHLRARWERAGLTPLPPERTIRDWLAAVEWPEPKKVGS